MVDAPRLCLSVGAVSEQGPHRANNQDSILTSPFAAFVADGVGGGPGGDIASATVIDALAASLGSPVELREQVRAANARIAALGAEQPALSGMATTLTGLVLGGDAIRLVHVGDSRAYLLRGGELRQVSRDDSWVQELIDDGTITPEAARHHPMRNVVVRSLAGKRRDADETSITEVAAEPGDRWLLASDGLTDYVEPERIAALLGAAEPQQAARALVDSAYAADTRDNVSVLVVDVCATAAATRGPSG